MSNLRRSTSQVASLGSSQKFRRQRQVGLFLLGGGALYTALYSRDRLPLQWTCPLLALTGLPCPTCGMTRSLAASSRGDWSTAWQFHAFGPPFLLLAAAAGVIWSAELWQGRSLLPWQSLIRRTWLPLVLGLLIYYGSRLWLSWQAGVWPPAWATTPLL